MHAKNFLIGILSIIIGIGAGWLLFSPYSPVVESLGEGTSQESSSSESSNDAQSSVAEKTCIISGCSSQLCGEEEMASTCEFREEYGCYASATCEVQTNGECGWTMTNELETCIEDARGEQALDARCSQQPDPGLCKAAMPRYFFNGSACEEFIWGGCGGSVPFETMAECEEVCA